MSDIDYSILAMDAYGRTDVGGGTAIVPVGAIFVANRIESSFSAVNYSYQGETVIAFRGTDDVGDFVSGWSAALGWTASFSSQIESAFSYYHEISATGSVVLTGHSLGGILAGIVNAFTDTTAVILDGAEIGSTVDFIYSKMLGAFETYNPMTPYAEYVQRVLEGEHWLEVVYGAAAEFMTEADVQAPVSNYRAYHVAGESISRFGLGVSDSEVLSPPDGSAFPNEGAPGEPEHNTALATILLKMHEFREDQSLPIPHGWEVSGKLFISALYDADVAVSAGITDQHAKFGGGNSADYLRHAIAYSASENGGPGGTVALDTLFDDADNLGQALRVPDVETSPGISRPAGVQRAAMLAELATIFAGAHALKATTGGALDGVLDYTPQVDDSGELSADISKATWEALGEDTHTAARETALKYLVEKALGEEDTSVTELVTSLSESGLIEKIKFLVSSESYEGTLFEDAKSVFVGTGLGDTITGSEGSDVVFGGDAQNGAGGTFDGGAGDDIVVGTSKDDTFTANAGSDYLSGGAGADTFTIGEGNGSVAVGGLGADVFNVSWQSICSGGDGDDIFNIAGPVVVWGGLGADQFIIETQWPIKIYFIDIQGLTDVNIANLDTNKLFSYFSANMGSSFGQDGVVIVNAELDDRLILNGKEAGSADYGLIEQFGEGPGVDYGYEAIYGAESDGLYYLPENGGSQNNVATLEIYDGYEVISTDVGGEVFRHTDLYYRPAEWTIFGFRQGLAGVSVSGDGPARIQQHDGVEVQHYTPDTWDTTAIYSVGVADITKTVYNRIDGTESDDTLTGTEDDDKVSALGGDDAVIAAHGGGDDYYDGGTGNDTIKFLSSTLGVFASLYDQVASGVEIGSDIVVAFENVVGGSGDDTIEGDSEINILNGVAGNDVLSAGAGDDILIGGTGADVLIGRDGNDTYVYERGDGHDVIIEGTMEGSADVLSISGVNGFTQTVVSASGKDLLIEIDPSTSAAGDGGSILIEDYLDMAGDYGVETIIDGDNNVWTKQDIFQFLYGNSSGGLDIWGTSENEVFVGTAQVDSFHGEDGDDHLIGNAGADSLIGGGGDDIIEGGTGDDWLVGDAGSDLIEGGGGADHLSGGLGDDMLLGGADDDTLLGEDGNDVIEGGSGDDWLVGGAGADTFVFRAGFGEDGMGDFEVGVDTLELHDQVALDFAGLMADAEEWGGNAWLHLENGDLIIMHGVALTDLSASDFRFM
ncbi:Mbeg1-like protein [Devosia sp.]|uniref:Mbeg1-like protein n=1 Tax=Devosia sp. TaxID=1871048 RepID=UPI0027341D5A|nr:Mbeg1-like protein [Devosia sp.]MDP2781876.1 DUF2974 domain-containing protein [Devosia sp.]